MSAILIETLASSHVGRVVSLQSGQVFSEPYVSYRGALLLHTDRQLARELSVQETDRLAVKSTQRSIVRAVARVIAPSNKLSGPQLQL